MELGDTSLFGHLAEKGTPAEAPELAQQIARGMFGPQNIFLNAAEVVSDGLFWCRLGCLWESGIRMARQLTCRGDTCMSTLSLIGT